MREVLSGPYLCFIIDGDFRVIGKHSNAFVQLVKMAGLHEQLVQHCVVARRIEVLSWHQRAVDAISGRNEGPVQIQVGARGHEDFARMPVVPNDGTGIFV